MNAHLAIRVDLSSVSPIRYDPYPSIGPVQSGKSHDHHSLGGWVDAIYRTL